MRRVLDYMHAHLKEDLSLAELAGLSGLARPNSRADFARPPGERRTVVRLHAAEPLRDFGSEPGSIPVGGDYGVGNGIGVAAAGSVLFYFCRRIPRVILLVFVLVSAARQEKFTFNSNGYGTRRPKFGPCVETTCRLRPLFTPGWPYSRMHEPPRRLDRDGK